MAMVELTVRKVGDELGVVLPREMIERLEAGDGERLFLVEGADSTHRLTRREPASEKKIAKAEDIIGR